MNSSSATLSASPAPWNRTIPRSRLFDALSLLLPAGEDFFIATLQEWRAQKDEMGETLDERFIDEIDRFTREERAHQRAHRRYNASLLAQMPAASAAAQRADRAAAELSGLSVPMKIALLAAFEHLTTLLSREILHRSYLMPDDGSPQSRLWRWHAAEELGHSQVAIEAALRCRVGYLRRALALVLATGYLTFDMLHAARALCHCDITAGAMSRGKVLADACRLIVGGLPSLARMAFGWCGYLLLPLSFHCQAE